MNYILLAVMLTFSACSMQVSEPWECDCKNMKCKGVTGETTVPFYE